MYPNVADVHAAFGILTPRPFRLLLVDSDELLLVDGVRCRGHVIYPNKLIVVDRRLPVEEQAEVFADALLDCLRRR